MIIHSNTTVFADILFQDPGLVLFVLMVQLVSLPFTPLLHLSIVKNSRKGMFHGRTYDKATPDSMRHSIALEEKAVRTEAPVRFLRRLLAKLGQALCFLQRTAAQHADVSGPFAPGTGRRRLTNPSS